jgi:hypothetical protein
MDTVDYYVLNKPDMIKEVSNSNGWDEITLTNGEKINKIVDADLFQRKSKFIFKNMTRYHNRGEIHTVDYTKSPKLKNLELRHYGADFIKTDADIKKLGKYNTIIDEHEKYVERYIRLLPNNNVRFEREDPSTEWGTIYITKTAGKKKAPAAKKAKKPAAGKKRKAASDDEMNALIAKIQKLL